MKKKQVNGVRVEKDLANKIRLERSADSVDTVKVIDFWNEYHPKRNKVKPMSYKSNDWILIMNQCFWQRTTGVDFRGLSAHNKITNRCC